MNKKESELENPVNNDSLSTPSFSNCNQSEYSEAAEELHPHLYPDYEDNTYEYYEPTEEKRDADYEDDAYECSKLNSENQDANKNLESCQDDNESYIHSTLLQRYNQETGQTTGLRNQAVFTLTALGFLVSMVIGFLGTNVFEPDTSLPLLMEVNLFWYVTGSISFVSCFILSIIVLWKVELKSSNHYLKYPDEDYLTKCMNTTSELKFNNRHEFRYLAFIINRNSKKNQKYKWLLLFADLSLFNTFICLVGVVVNVILLSIN